jgi:hypothetical protein
VGEEEALHRTMVDKTTQEVSSALEVVLTTVTGAVPLLPLPTGVRAQSMVSPSPTTPGRATGLLDRRPEVGVEMTASSAMATAWAKHSYPH